jgi:hypothetical protein
LIKEQLCFLYNTKRAFKALPVFRLLRKKIAAYRTNSYPIERSNSSSFNNITNTLGENEIKLEEEEEDERYSCWCFLLIEGNEFEAKIIHKGRGKFKILNDEYGGKYTNKMVDASDVVRCRIEI